MISVDFLITSLVVVLLPGTGVIYTVSNGLFLGSRASVWAAIGCTMGIVPHLLASILGLAAVLHTSALVFQVLKFLGVAYLLYLGWSMWRQAAQFEFVSPDQRPGFRDTALRGFLINILNPKLSLFFLAFLPQFVPIKAEGSVSMLLVLSLIFMLMTLVVFVFYGLLAHRVSAFVSQSRNTGVLLQKIFAGTFIALGIRLAFAQR